MLFSLFLGVSAVCAIFPAVLFCINLRRFQPPPPADLQQTPAISVLIPARNEEANIATALEHILASRNVNIEVLVLDDGSTDRTAGIVQDITARDPRLKLLEGHSLPPGWNGKQHACWTLAQQASHPVLVFLDADVRIEPDFLARMAAFRIRTGTALVSGFPRLITITWLEKLLLPLIHFILLGFLPMRAMRSTTRPSVAAGCGQFFLADSNAYFASGGHKAIRETMHDGLLLPRTFRRAGYRTDIADITALASVRMYNSAAEVWQGLAKNATEAIATPGKIVPITLLLFVGQVLPAMLALYLLALPLLLVTFHFAGEALFNLLLKLGSPYLVSVFIAAHGGFRLSYNYVAILILALLLSAIACSYLPRLLAIRRFRQPLSSALLHPLGIFVLLALQWYALARKLVGKPVGWRQRIYSSGTGAEVGS